MEKPIGGILTCNKENEGLGGIGDMSKSLRTKKSLTVISANEIARRSIVNEVSKPIKQRVISESTGLVKFSLTNGPVENPFEQQKQASPRKSGLPIHLQVDSPVRKTEKEHMVSPFLSPLHNKNNQEVTPEEKLLFTYAKKQREVMELRSRLEFAEKELRDLESQLKVADNPIGQLLERERQAPPKFLNVTNPMLDLKKKLTETKLDRDQNTSPIRQVLKSKVSMLGFQNQNNTGSSELTKSLSRQQSMLKIRQDINEISNTLITDGKKFQNEFFTKGRTLFQNLGNELNNTIRTAIPEGKEPLFGQSDNDSDSSDLTYSSDLEISIEELEGGFAVPFEIPTTR